MIQFFFMPMRYFLSLDSSIILSVFNTEADILRISDVFESLIPLLAIFNDVFSIHSIYNPLPFSLLHVQFDQFSKNDQAFQISRRNVSFNLMYFEAHLHTYNPSTFGLMTRPYSWDSASTNERLVYISNYVSIILSKSKTEKIPKYSQFGENCRPPKFLPSKNE